MVKLFAELGLLVAFTLDWLLLLEHAETSTKAAPISRPVIERIDLLCSFDTCCSWLSIGEARRNTDFPANTSSPFHIVGAIQ